jgi:hypothetical protein
MTVMTLSARYVWQSWRFLRSLSQFWTRATRPAGLLNLLPLVCLRRRRNGNSPLAVLLPCARAVITRNKFRPSAPMERSTSVAREGCMPFVRTEPRSGTTRTSISLVASQASAARVKSKLKGIFFLRERNSGMHASLEKCGFLPTGVPYPSDRGDYKLQVFVRHAAGEGSPDGSPQR